MSRKPVWLEMEVVISVHQEQVAEHGGASGMRDKGLLESALARPRHLFAYGHPSPEDLAAAYAAGIVKNHPFVDGNKRTGFLAAYTFLGRNRRRLEASEAEATLAVVGLASGEIPEAQFARWLKDNTASQ